jgi:quercetin dioxygenase-like cupin family protein
MKRAYSLNVLGVVLLMPSAYAQDALAVKDANLHLRLENDRVRVLERILQPGERESIHSHPSYVIYVVKGGKIRDHGGSGKVADINIKAGDVIYRDPVTHWAENIGTTTIEVVVVELKGQVAPASGP